MENNSLGGRKVSHGEMCCPCAQNPGIDTLLQDGLQRSQMIHSCVGRKEQMPSGKIRSHKMEAKKNKGQGKIEGNSRKEKKRIE